MSITEPPSWCKASTLTERKLMKKWLNKKMPKWVPWLIIIIQVVVITMMLYVGLGFTDSEITKAKKIYRYFSKQFGDVIRKETQ